ncbi:MAG: hypothetical protein ACP5JG_18840 [Anaerolineae bacterium]
MVNIVERVDDRVEIRRVLVSVSDKSGLDTLIPGLIEIVPQIRFFSTGGTYRAIAEILGERLTAEHLTPVAAYTGQPETQGGLVKTLDFKIYLGLLTETHNPAHQADLARTEAVPIDMVVVNLYPFEATVSQEDVTVEEARANIDIGGPCMLRAAAKNYLRVTPIVDPADYGPLLATLREGAGALSLTTRFGYARKAFEHTAAYDAAIVSFLRHQDPDDVRGAYPELKAAGE